MKKYGKGWFLESKRHSLARQGIKTGRKTNYSLNINYNTKYNAGDTVAGEIIPGNKVRADITGDVIKLNKEQLKGLSVGDKVTLTFGGPDRVSEVELDNKINYYKISSISDKSKLHDIQGEINKRLKEKGYSVFVSVKDSSINLSDIRISEERVQEQGHNLQYTPYTKSGVRKTRSLSWDDWVEVNNTVNDILDEHNIKANVKSLSGKFDIRDKTEGRRTEKDWENLSTENVGSIVNPVSRRDYIKKPQTTKFETISEKGKVGKSMSINLGKIKSPDPLAYAYGYFQAKSGRPISKDKDLAPEYIRGFKDAKAGKKIGYANNPIKVKKGYEVIYRYKTLPTGKKIRLAGYRKKGKKRVEKWVEVKTNRVIR